MTGKKTALFQPPWHVPAALDKAVLSAGTLAAKLAGFYDDGCHERSAIWRQKP